MTKFTITPTQRPNDSDQLLLYYEDINVAPQVYISKEGDNIRKVSMELLGDEGSWKEVWATNLHVDSKGQIPGGLELKYWPHTSTHAVDSPKPLQTTLTPQFGSPSSST